MPLIPTIEQARRYFETGIPGKEAKWEERTTGAADIWEVAAKSREAEEAYAAGVDLAVRQQLRLRGLDPITARDFQTAVRGMGTFWREKAVRRAPKWAFKFRPYLEEIRRIVPGLPAKIPGRPRENVLNRVVPIAEGLHRLKIGASPGAALTPSPTPGASPRFGFGQGFGAATTAYPGAAAAPAAPTPRVPFTQRY